jgi:HlyD family secretion protein
MIKTIFATIAVALPVGWVSYTFYQAYSPLPVRLQGQIEAQQYNASSKVAGRIDQVLVRKGDKVKKGQLIFTIYSPELDARLEQAKAGKEVAVALAQEAENGARKQQIEATRNQWQKAQAAAELLEKTYKRINSLYNDGVLSEQKRDETYTKWQAAKYTADAASQMLQMIQEGVRDETKKAALEKVRMAAGAVSEVEAYAADTKVQSWHNGEVTQILLHGGELAPQGFPVVTIMDMEDAWLVLHVREDMLKDFNQGQEFKAMIPALGDEPYTFFVSHVAVMGDFATWRATDNSKGFDIRTFEIECRPLEPIKGLRAGMSVLVEKNNV